MTAREAIAHAITHAPRGQKGGPYWAERGGRTSDIRLAMRFSPEGIEAATSAANHADARVIRIVRKARSSPSEASAVDVLRELVAWDDAPSEGQLEPTIHRARRGVGEWAYSELYEWILEMLVERMGKPRRSCEPGGLSGLDGRLHKRDFAGRVCEVEWVLGIPGGAL